jgi:tRNA (Thr-GGU) A37 N-methylase
VRPLLDIKPYFASTDAVPDAAVGWHAEQKR